jgi:hypothetical protein
MPAFCKFYVRYHDLIHNLWTSIETPIVSFFIPMIRPYLAHKLWLWKTPIHDNGTGQLAGVTSLRRMPDPTLDISIEVRVSPFTSPNCNPCICFETDHSLVPKPFHTLYWRFIFTSWLSQNFVFLIQIQLRIDKIVNLNPNQSHIHYAAS